MGKQHSMPHGMVGAVFMRSALRNSALRLGGNIDFCGNPGPYTETSFTLQPTIPYVINYPPTRFCITEFLKRSAGPGVLEEQTESNLLILERYREIAHQHGDAP